MQYNKDLAILIPACDAYLDVFSEYMRYFRLNWPDCPFELILITETKEVHDERVTSITTSDKTEWAGRILAGAEATECQYLLTSIEDGFISERVNTDEVLSILEFMKRAGIQYYRNPKRDIKKVKNPICKEYPNAYKIRKNQIYGVNMGYVIWDRKKLIEVFGDGEKNAWQIEEHLNEIALNSDDGYYDEIVSDKHNFLHVIETVSGGKWMPTEIRRLEALGLPVNLGNRGVLPKADIYRRRLHWIANRIVMPEHRKKVKRLFSALGYRFVTKN